MNRGKDATNMELAFTQSMQKKMLWFQFHLNHIRPVHRFEKRKDSTQINVLGKLFRNEEPESMIVQ